MKQRFAALTQEQRGIQAKLQKFARANGVKLDSGDQLKVEISSEGKVLVGGIKDAKQARKLEEAINKDHKLVDAIKTYQNEEMSISHALETATGKSLGYYKSRIDDLQKGGWLDNLSGDGDMVYSSEQAIALKDQDLYIVDDEFGTMISEFYAQPSGADISGGNNILEHADDVVESEFNSIMKDVNAYLADVNKSVRKKYGDPEEAKLHLVSLSNVSIRLTSDGNVTIDGSFSESGSYDNTMKNAITSIFNKALESNPQTGWKTDFAIASQYLEGQYDFAFDGEDKNRKVEVAYEDGKVKSRLSSPKEEERLNEEIADEAKAALTEMGVNADSLEIIVNEGGKLAVANMPQNKQEADVLKHALDTLNNKVKERSKEDYNNLDNATDPIDRLKGLLAKIDIFRSGGLDVLSKLT